MFKKKLLVAGLGATVSPIPKSQEMSCMEHLAEVGLPQARKFIIDFDQ